MTYKLRSQAPAALHDDHGGHVALVMPSCSASGGHRRPDAARCTRDEPLQAKEEHPDATEEAGPWLFTLDFPSYMPIMTHAKNRCAAFVHLLQASICPDACHKTVRCTFIPCMRSNDHRHDAVTIFGVRASRDVTTRMDLTNPSIRQGAAGGGVPGVPDACVQRRHRQHARHRPHPGGARRAGQAAGLLLLRRQVHGLQGAS